jgi:hypothetical protein
MSLHWLVLSDWPALLLVVGLAVGFPGVRDGWRAGLEGFAPVARRVFPGLVVAGAAALVWLAWAGDEGLVGKAAVLLAVPLVAMGNAVMAERWRIGLASAVPVGWTDGWRQSVYMGLRDWVRLVVAVAVTGLAVFLPEPLGVVALGIGALALAAGRWWEHRPGGMALLSWICVAAAWILTAEVLLVLAVKRLPPPLAVVAVVLRAAVVVVLFAGLVQTGEGGRAGGPKTLRLRAGRESGKPGRIREAGRMKPRAR